MVNLLVCGKVLLFGAFWNLFSTICDPELVQSTDMEPWIWRAAFNSMEQHIDESLKVVVGGTEGESEQGHTKIRIFRSWRGWNHFYSALEKAHLENNT